MLDAMAIIIALGLWLEFTACSFIFTCRELHHHQIELLHTLGPLIELLYWRVSLGCYAMPRLRGTPRRGAAWQAAKSRRNRQKLFERAMAIAARRRRRWGWAVIEEESPGEEQVTPPELNFASEHFNPASTSAGASGQSNCANSGQDEPYSPCFIEEEPPPEPSRPDQGEPTRPDHGEHRQTTQEDIDPAQAHPAAVDSLSLIFDVRQVLDDLVFRIERLERRMDLFFAAHSRATQKKQCPTCARPYAFPARWRHTEAAEIYMDAKVP